MKLILSSAQLLSAFAALWFYYDSASSYIEPVNGFISLMFQTGSLIYFLSEEYLASLTNIRPQ